MCALSICIRNKYVRVRTRACTEHTRHQKLVRAFSILRIRNSCMHWAYYASGTYACTEHTHQKLMHALSIHIRNLCVRWAYASGTYALSILRIRYLCTHWAYASETYACSEHTHQELMRVLSICTKNLYGCWAYTSVPCAYAQHKHNNSKLEKVPSMLSIRVRNSCCTEPTHQELTGMISVGIRI